MYSPGLDLNDVGYLRQADVIANQVFLGWAEASPKGIFRSYSAQLSREDQWDFGGLQTAHDHRLRRFGPVQEQVAGGGAIRIRRRGGLTDAARRSRAAVARLLHRVPGRRAPTPSRRASISTHAEHSWARDDDSRSSILQGTLNVRPSNRLSLSGNRRERPARRQPAVRRDRRDRCGSALGTRPHRPEHLDFHAEGQPLGQRPSSRSSTTAAPSSAPVTTRASRRRPIPWRAPARTAPISTAPARSPSGRKTTRIR